MRLCGVTVALSYMGLNACSVIQPGVEPAVDLRGNCEVLDSDTVDALARGALRSYRREVNSAVRELRAAGVLDRVALFLTVNCELKIPIEIYDYSLAVGVVLLDESGNVMAEYQTTGSRSVEKPYQFTERIRRMEERADFSLNYAVRGIAERWAMPEQRELTNTR